jgi:hypothetical protein
MRFWWISVPAYLAALAAGLVLSVGNTFLQRPTVASTLIFYGLCVLTLGAASLLVALMCARLLFPHYWWLGQVLGEDVYELDGVYFQGVRLSKVSERVQRLVFGAGDKFRKWNIAFGLLWLLLMVAHGLAAMTSQRTLESMLPKPVRLPETLHAAFLSDLPVMRGLRRPWTPDSALMKTLQEETDRLQSQRGKTEMDWLRLAQLHLIRAYRVRKGTADAFSFSPMDRIFFQRGVGAQAADAITQILAIPEAKRAPVTRGALTLLGFFHLAEYNYTKADRALSDALGKPATGDTSQIPLYWTRLLAAQAALLRGVPAEARKQLEAVAAEKDLPKRIEALAVEHAAEAVRLEGGGNEVSALLEQAEQLYTELGDLPGQSRIHLRRAVWLTDLGDAAGASEELSAASAQAESADDVFALNMVVRATHRLPMLQ